MKRLLLAYFILIFQCNLKASSFEPKIFDPTAEDKNLDFFEESPVSYCFTSLSLERAGLDLRLLSHSLSPIPLRSKCLGSGTHGSVVFYDETPHLCSKKISKRGRDSHYFP